MIIILLLLSFAEYEKAFLAVLAIIGAIVVWKSGLIQTLVGGQKQLIELRTAELQQSKDRNNFLELRIKELEDYNRLLILNNRTTFEVSQEIKRNDQTNPSSKTYKSLQQIHSP